jgi:multidrug resistance efflux pump
MANPTRLEINCETGEVTEVELTDAEVADLQAQADAAKAEQDRIAAEQKAKDDAKASAIAKLAKLGLSDSEISALIGA